MKLVSDWSEIVDNCYQFNTAIMDQNTVPFKRFSQFYHWYYFPQFKLFAPSKFIGYKSTTAKNYKGEGTGTETTQVLNKYFYKVDKNSKEFKKLFNQLTDFAQDLNKKINKKTSEGSGGIYLPKNNYLNKEGQYTLSLYKTVQLDLDSIANEENKVFTEGKKKAKLVQYYERNPKIRARAISYHGLTCKVCGFNFEKFYGDRGKYFIEVHHLVPVSKFNKEIKVDYKKDMTVLCANCHRMIHRNRNTPLTIKELKSIIRKNAT